MLLVLAASICAMVFLLTFWFVTRRFWYRCFARTGRPIGAPGIQWAKGMPEHFVDPTFVSESALINQMAINRSSTMNQNQALEPMTFDAYVK